MKIGLVRRGFSATGGAEAYLLRLAHGLVQAGHEPVLMTSSAWPADRWPGSSIIRLKADKPLAFARAFQAERWPVDITFSLERVPGCDVFRAGDGVHAAWLRRRSEFEPAWKAWFHRWNPKHLALMELERGVFRSAKAVIVNSRMVADEIAHWHDYDPKKIHLVPNGIGASFAAIPREEARTRLALSGDAYVVLFVGTGWERKGLKFLVEAAERLPGDTVVLVAGRGKPAGYASSKVRFLGPTSDLSTVFSAADVFALPTVYDPFSNACLEALAAGLPVITTSANGFAEILTPGVHGEIVAPGDVEGLAAALRKWRGHPDVREACRALAGQYSIERNVSETLRVLTMLAEGRQTAGAVQN